MADAPAEPVPLEVACAQVRVRVGRDDDTIRRLITDAREFVEGETGLVLVPRMVTETAAHLGRWIDLRSWPVSKVTAIRAPLADQLAPLAAGAFVASYARRPVRVLPAITGWGVPGGFGWACQATLPVEIDVQAGYTDAALIPARATRAMLLLIAHWYDNRNAAEVGQRAAAIELPLGVSDLLRRLKLKSC